MGHARIWIAGIVVLAGVSGCLNYTVVPEKEPLTGEAYLAAPLDGANVEVETAAGNPIGLSSDSVTTEGRFFAELALLTPQPDELPWYSSYLPLTVKVSGGTCNGVEFDGTLLGYVSAFSPRNHLHVNILTTLVVKYAQATGVTLSEAEIAVKSALNIPADVDLAGRLNDPNFWKYMDPARFMALVPANGGFDAFVNRIVANLVGSQTAGFPLKAENSAPEIASKAAELIIEGVGEGLGSFATEKALGWILGKFGIEDPTESALNEITNQLTQMNATLTNIESEIGTLTTEVSQLLALVQLEWDDLISKYDSLNMSEPENIIQNQYNNMLTTFSPSSGQLCTPAGNAAALKVAQQILGDYSGVNYDIDQQVYNMYANIVGNVPGSNGALYDLTSELVDRVKAGDDLFNAYVALETYFGQLAGIQAQGLELMIEALHMTQTPIGSGGLTTFAGTDTDYYNKFYGQMNQEVEIFLECVDRLVVADIDVRSEIAQKFAYLAPETAQVYNRADYVARRLSTVQPAGVIVRLIGDPNSVSDWVTNHKLTIAGQNPVTVAVNGNNINKYAAVLPAATPAGVNYYLTWTANGTAYTFQKETQVSIVKLQSPAATPAAYVVKTPTGSQTLNVAWYNENFQQVGSGAGDNLVAYANGVCYVRTLPAWRSGSATESKDKKKDVHVDVDARSR